MRAAGRWSARRKSRLTLTPETGAAIGWRECAMLLSRCRSTTKVNTTAAIFGGRNAAQTDKACQGATAGLSTSSHHWPKLIGVARAGAVSRVQLARLSARIWCHFPDLPVGPDGMSQTAGLAAAAPPVLGEGEDDALVDLAAFQLAVGLGDLRTA